MIAPKRLTDHLAALAQAPVTNGGMPLCTTEPWPPPYMPRAEWREHHTVMVEVMRGRLRDMAHDRGLVLIAYTEPFEINGQNGQRVLRVEAYAVPVVTLPHNRDDVLKPTEMP